MSKDDAETSVTRERHWGRYAIVLTALVAVVAAAALVWWWPGNDANTADNDSSETESSVEGDDEEPVYVLTGDEAWCDELDWEPARSAYEFREEPPDATTDSRIRDDGSGWLRCEFILPLADNEGFDSMLTISFDVDRDVESAARQMEHVESTFGAGGPGYPADVEVSKPKKCEEFFAGVVTYEDNAEDWRELVSYCRIGNIVLASTVNDAVPKEWWLDESFEEDLAQISPESVTEEILLPLLEDAIAILPEN